MTKEHLEAAIGTLDTLIQVFAILVAIGIVGEVGFGVRHWVLNRRLHTIQHAEDLAQEQAIAALTKDAAEANERAAKAEENLGNAKKASALAEQHAAEANRIAEEERLARVKLEASLKPRRLTSKQKDDLTAQLRPFAPTPIKIEWPGNADPETVDLSRDINDAIVSAGIPMSDATRSFLIGTTFRGFYFKVGATRKDEAEIIAKFLIDVGLASKPVPNLRAEGEQDLVIGIGFKPLDTK